MAHTLIASPFLDGHLLLKPGARAGARIPADHYEGLRQAAADGESDTRFHFGQRLVLPTQD